MPRANRHFIPGYIWHVTHRCHKKEFLLKLGRDRRRWLWWRYQARKRFNFAVLNYTVTCNHIHLLVSVHPIIGKFEGSICYTNGNERFIQ